MKLRVIYNKIIPFGRYEAMVLFVWLFAKRELTQSAINHELIHTYQQIEVTVVGAMLACVLVLIGCGWSSLFALPLFFYWYGLEYLFRLIQYRDGHKAYRSISFEQEAYYNQDDYTYIAARKLFAWIRYL